MRKIISLTLILALLLTLVACGETAPKETTTPAPIETKEPENKDPFLVEDDIIDSTNEIPIDYYEYVNKVCDERKEWVKNGHKWHKDYLSKVSMYAGDPDLLTRKEFDMLSEQKPYNAYITIEQAIEDTHYLFRAYRSCFGSYAYYGEEKFFEAESNIIEYLNDYREKPIHSNSTTPKISSTLFINSLKDNLDFIYDTHSRLDSENFSDINEIFEYSYFGSIYIFRQDDMGYYTKIYDKKWYITDVNGNEPTDYMKVSINKTGELVYRVVSVHNPIDNFKTAKLTLTRGSKSVDVNFSWKQLDYLYNNVYDAFGVYETPNGITAKESMSSLVIKNEIPVLSVRYFHNEKAGDEELLHSYTSSGRELKNQSTFIVDARSNGGGASKYSYEWMRAYTGRDMEYPHVYAKRATYTQSHPNTAVGDSISHIAGSSFYENKNNTIFITDKRSGSSGEGIVEMYRLMSNTLIVGSNTEGCLIGGDVCHFFLPNSGIYAAIGTGFHLSGTAETPSLEGIGYMPDVFVNSKEALDLSLAMIEYYGLEKSQNLDDLTLFGWDEK